MSALEPGLYRATINDKADVIVMKGRDEAAYLVSTGHLATRRINSGPLTDARPLIVLDLGDSEFAAKSMVETLCAAQSLVGISLHDFHARTYRIGHLQTLINAIEAQTKPMYSTTTQHSAEQCKFEQCAYCGCCAHGKTLMAGCKVEGAPSGMGCPTWGCGCEGLS